MSQKVKLRKGLNIPLKGKAEKVFEQSTSAVKSIALKPTDFNMLTPKPAIAEGDKVKAGDAVFFDKNRPEVKFTSPVSGTLKQIVRGDRRRILAFVIEPDGQNESVKFEVENPAKMGREKVIETLLNAGAWPLIKQRPYDIIANPSQTPKAIFVSGFDSAPLAPDYDFILTGQQAEFQMGIDVLKMLTDGQVHLSYNGEYPISKVYSSVQGAEIHDFEGPHPAGNVGVQINHIDSINKGEIVWTVNPQDLLIIGRLFSKGVFDATKVIALTGSQVKAPKYYRTVLGANVADILAGNVEGDNNRIISGNVLTGTQIDANGFLGFFSNQITVIPEGNDYEFMGWAAPGFNKFSAGRTFFSWLMPKKEYEMNTNTHGEPRAIVVSNQYDSVLPMDIYPEFLIKAIMAQDIDKMEQLGIYEVIEEDLALCEFACTSKIQVQKILRNGLNLMYTEVG